MNGDLIFNLVGSLGTMKYFPSDPIVKVALAQLMSDLTDDENAVRWLVKKLRTEYAEWPGEREVRAVFCERFRPKDGIVIAPCTCGCGGSEHGSNTFKLAPAQSWPPRLEAPAVALLPAAPLDEKEQAEMEALRQTLRDRGFKAMPRPRVLDIEADARLREIETAPKDRAELPPPVEPMSAKRRREIEAAIAAELAKRREQKQEEGQVTR